MKPLQERPAFQAILEAFRSIEASGFDDKERAMLLTQSDMCLRDYQVLFQQFVTMRIEAGKPADWNTAITLERLVMWLLDVGAASVSQEAARKLLAKEKSEAGKASGDARRKIADDGWKALALKLATDIAREGKLYSANGLANAVFAKWTNPKNRPSDPKQIREYLARVAEHSDAPFILKVDGRSKKVRKGAV